MIVLQTNIDNEKDHAFLSHWEEVTQLSINYQMLSALDEGIPRPGRSGMCYHKSFFEASSTKRSVPFPFVTSMLNEMKQWYIKYIDNHLVPASSGDMLWLSKRFL
jgi:hypothetical protein